MPPTDEAGWRQEGQNQRIFFVEMLFYEKEVQRLRANLQRALIPYYKEAEKICQAFLRKILGIIALKRDSCRLVSQGVE